MRPLALVLTLLAPLPARAFGQSGPHLELLDTAVLRAPRLIESSGVTPSARVRGVLWTHNDSGDEPRLYATDSSGDDLGSVRVAGATNVDWEDLGAGPCPEHADHCLYVADIGDNDHRRHDVVLYVLAEPQPPRGPADTLAEAPLAAAIRLRYPDRPHDAEAVAIEPSGHVLIITKELLRPPLVFLVPPRRAPQRPGEVDTLRLLGHLDLAPSLPRLRMVTGAAVSPAGDILVVRTYSSLHFYRLRGDSLPVPLTGPTGLTIPVVEPQGEGVAFLTRDLLVLTTERGDADHAIVSRVRVSGLAGGRP